MRNDIYKGWRNVIRLADSACIICSFLLAIYIRRNQNFFEGKEYQTALFVLVLLYIFIDKLRENKEDKILSRGYLKELSSVIQNQGIVILIWFAYLFVVKESELYSRLIMINFFILSVSSIYVARCYIKLLAFIKFKKKGEARECLVITVRDRVEEIVDNFTKKQGWDVNLVGLIVIDEDMAGQFIRETRVCANLADIVEYTVHAVVDEVFINVPFDSKFDFQGNIALFQNMGILVHINVDIYNIEVENKIIGKFVGYNVISYANRILKENALIIKRIMDIIGAVVGLIIFLFMLIFIAPIIKLNSKGPVFFAQNRVGRNGRVFKIYKLRTMCIDAEEKKKSLLENNEMQGLMFKMKNDPRITSVGRFLRSTSIDEFPQFWNVLIGDMSLVGTRPPTIQEFENYEYHHKKRLSIKPGITGMWQVNGRSNITDFEKIVEMDSQYIDQWSIGLDVKILLKTFFIVIFRIGAS